MDGDLTELRRVQGELKVRLREAKEKYSRKNTRKLQDNNIREVWNVMRTIIGGRKAGSAVEGD